MAGGGGGRIPAGDKKAREGGRDFSQVLWESGIISGNLAITELSSVASQDRKRKREVGWIMEIENYQRKWNS